jgi:hypothetical protein
MAVPSGALWAGRIISGLVVLFLVFDGVMKFVKPVQVVDATRQLGYPEADIVPLGTVLLVCTALYCVPRTSILGAILLTGYLGGAIASQWRAGNPAFNIIFASGFAVLVWLGLWLRDEGLRGLIP